MSLKIKSNFSELHNSKGITLVHLLLIISAFSAFSLIYINSDKTFNEERMAALTVARVHALLDRMFLSRRLSADESGWVDFCNNHFALNNLGIDEYGIDGWRNANGFNYPFLVHDSTCTERVMVIYYYVPQRWSGYIRNHLEATYEVNVQGDLAELFPSYVEFVNNGFVVLGTSIDIYGNLKNGASYVSKEFESGGLSRDASVSSGYTQVEIPKPECVGRTPKIHYSVSGVCSFYPIDGDPYGLETIIDSNDEFTAEDYYKTYGFEFHLGGDCIDSACDREQPWVISLNANERWGNAVTITSDGDTEVVRGDPPYLVAASPSIEHCYGRNVDRGEFKRIWELIESLGFYEGFFLSVSDFLDYLDVDYTSYWRGLDIIFNIDGEEFRRQAILDMRLERFENELGVDLDDYIDSDVLDENLKVNAWVTCEV